jgi:hypothetical protein
MGSRLSVDPQRGALAIGDAPGAAIELKSPGTFALLPGLTLEVSFPSPIEPD